MNTQETGQNEGPTPPGDPNELLVEVLGNLPGTIILAFDRRLRALLLAGGEAGDVNWGHGDVVGAPLADLLPTALYVRNEPQFQAALAGEERAEELRIDDRTWWVKSRPLRTPSGKVYAGLAIATDISDRRVDEIRRLRLDVQLERGRRLEAVGKLAGGVAHDFNNLLAVVLNYADFVTDSLAEDDPARDDMKEIKRAAQRGAALTRQLLIFSQRESADPRVIDLNQILTELEKLLRRTLGADVDLQIQLASDLATVLADPGQIEQAVAGMAINAREAMPAGGSLTIKTANCSPDEAFAEDHPEVIDGDYVKVSISDTGKGIHPSQIERIFEPFFTTKQKSEGGGLGLAAAHGIVTNAGGIIDVHSESAGTTFDLYFPSTSGKAAPGGDQITALNEDTAGTSVLIAEDDDFVRRMAVRVLESSGYEVVSCADGREAIAAIESEQHNFDLVLTDVVMPEASGSEVAARAAELHPELPVLLMSGYTEDLIPSLEMLERNLTLLRKPFTARELLDHVAQQLRQPADEG